MEYEMFLRFPQNKVKAVTLSYDDGVVADKHLLEIINKYGLKCTFNLNSGIFPDRGLHNRMLEQETFDTFNNCGHEIALHGRKHLFLTKVPNFVGIDDVVSDRVYLESKYNCLVNGMAYAYGAFNEEIKSYLRMCGVKYARTTVPTNSFDLPKDFLEWNPTCHHNSDKLDELVDKFVNTTPLNEIKAREPYLFYLWGHSYEYDDRNNWNVLENFAKQIACRQDVWYATNGEVFRYVTAYNNLQFGIRANVVFNPSAVDVWFEMQGKCYCAKAGELTHLGN